jgi:hypothetical protein
MSLGPIDVVVIEFKGNKFKGEIGPAMQEIIDKGIVRILDLAFVLKDQDGIVAAFEAADMVDDEGARVLDAMTDEVSGLLAQGDILEIAESLENNSSAALLLFEHTWAAKLKQAVLNADGRLVAQVRIPHEVIEEALSAREATV